MPGSVGVSWPPVLPELISEAELCFEPTVEQMRVGQSAFSPLVIPACVNRHYHSLVNAKREAV